MLATWGSCISLPWYLGHGVSINLFVRSMIQHKRLFDDPWTSIIRRVYTVRVWLKRCTLEKQFVYGPNTKVHIQLVQKGSTPVNADETRKWSFITHLFVVTFGEFVQQSLPLSSKTILQHWRQDRDDVFCNKNMASLVTTENSVVAPKSGAIFHTHTYQKLTFHLVFVCAHFFVFLGSFHE